MTQPRVPHHWTFAEIAGLLGVTETLIRGLFARGIDPCWTWHEGWAEPRFDEEAVYQWREILERIVPTTSSNEIALLETPGQVFTRGFESVGEILARALQKLGRSGFMADSEQSGT
jgi:hypothetical protein